MRKSRRDYKMEASAEKFEVSLEPGDDGEERYVTFKNPWRLKTDEGLSFMQLGLEDQLSLALGEDFPKFWAEWSDVPLEETQELIADVTRFYGSGAGKSKRSTGSSTDTATP